MFSMISASGSTEPAITLQKVSGSSNKALAGTSQPPGTLYAAITSF